MSRQKVFRMCPSCFVSISHSTGQNTIILHPNFERSGSTDNPLFRMCSAALRVISPSRSTYFFRPAAMRRSHSPHLFSFLLLPQKGQTALMRASQNGHYNVVEKLLPAGAQPDIQDKVRNVVTMVMLIQVPNEYEVATLISF